ncbi:MAG: hypothetical protein NC131_12865 [Roseburia sp.]|nr:hypothetical protein [Roseburia sp.]
MQISIDLLDLRTVDKAIRRIEQYQKRIEELIPEFLKRCAEVVRDKANDFIDGLGYDEATKTALKGGWKPIKKDNPTVLENAYDKAVYIEFGTGIVGSGQSHEMASESGYKYDMNAHGEKGWRFNITSDEWADGIDLPDAYYSKSNLGHTGMWFTIRTKGAPATMFLYQAASDFMDYKLYKRIWNELTKGK